jgi:hypothetical protein
MIPLTTMQLANVVSDRVNAMPARIGLIGTAYFTGGAGWNNANAPNIIPVIDFPIPTVGTTFHSRTDLNGTYLPNDCRETVPWTNRGRLRLPYDWAQGYTDPNDVPAGLRGNTFAVISVPGPDDMAYASDGTTACFRVGTVVYDGTYASCTTYFHQTF